MYQEERLIAIMEQLKAQKRISVDEICQLFSISRDTARRDLVILEEQGTIIRTRGGALLPQLKEQIKSYNQRLETFSQEKRKIGQVGASLIRTGDHILLDASTTVQACAESITTSCTVVTNSIHQATLLAANQSSIQVHLLGGMLEKDHFFLYGPSVTNALTHFYVDRVFLGVIGISEHGFTVGHEDDGVVMKKMIQQAKQAVILADASKFNQTGFYRFAGFEEIDILITNEEPPCDLKEQLTNHNVELMVVS